MTELPPLPKLDAFIAYPHGKDIVTGESMDTLYRKDVERLMRDYGRQCIEDYKKSLKPVAWLDIEYGSLHKADIVGRTRHPAFVPLYRLDKEQT